MKKTFVYIVAGLFLIAGIGLIQSQVREDPKDSNPAATGLNPEGQTFHIPQGEQTKPNKSVPVLVRSFEFERLTKESNTGKTGDLLITFLGEGFSINGAMPKIRLGKELLLNNIEANKEGTELYLIISRDWIKERMANLNFSHLTILNVGYSKDRKQLGETVKMSQEDLEKGWKEGGKIALVWEKGGFMRKKQ